MNPQRPWERDDPALDESGRERPYDPDRPDPMRAQEDNAVADGQGAIVADDDRAEGNAGDASPDASEPWAAPAATPGRLTITPRVIGGEGNPPGRPAWARPDAEDEDRPYDPDRPDPVWALEDIDDDRYDAVGRRRIPRWVIVIVILMALALLLQLAWPMIADLLDRARDDSGFPTPGTI